MDLIHRALAACKSSLPQTLLDFHQKPMHISDLSRSPRRRLLLGLLHNEILSKISLQNGDFPALNSCKWKTRHLHVNFPHFEVIVPSREVNIVSLSEQKRMSPHVKIGLLITYFLWLNPMESNLTLLGGIYIYIYWG